MTSGDAMNTSVTDLLSNLEERGLRLVVEAGSLKLRGPAERMPGPEVVEKLRQRKTEILEALYHHRAERALQVICRHGAPGMVPWLADHSPLLYHLMTSSLPDRISKLWNEHAPLADFDRALNDWLGIYFLADSEYRAAREVDATSKG